MTDNILKKQVERTANELVAEVYPADRTYRDLADEKDVKRGKKYYDFISVSIVGPGFGDAVPVCVKIARGRKSKMRRSEAEGSPRKPPVKEPGQLELVFPDAA